MLRKRMASATFETEANSNATVLLSLKHPPERQNPGLKVCRDRNFEAEQLPASIYHDAALLPLVKRPRICTKEHRLATLLKVDDISISGVLTTRFGVREPGLMEQHNWHAKIERPRSTWRKIDIAQHLDTDIRALYEGAWKRDDFGSPSNRSKFVHITSMIFGLPLTKELLGLSQDARLLRGQRHGRCRAIHCGWCTEHVHEAFRNNGRELCLDKLWENGACTRCIRFVGKDLNGTWKLECQEEGHHQLMWVLDPNYHGERSDTVLFDGNIPIRRGWKLAQVIPRELALARQRLADQ